jgi:hypothetical protein
VTGSLAACVQPIGLGIPEIDGTTGDVLACTMKTFEERRTFPVFFIFTETDTRHLPTRLNDNTPLRNEQTPDARYVGVPFRGDETTSNTFNFVPAVGETCDQTNVEPEAPSVVVNANETPDENTSETIMNVNVINSRLIAIGKDYLAQRDAKYAPLSKTTKKVLNNKQWRRRRESKSTKTVIHNPVSL